MSPEMGESGDWSQWISLRDVLAKEIPGFPGCINSICSILTHYQSSIKSQFSQKVKMLPHTDPKPEKERK